jgi:ectoine hydroxylase-related dioxygenase (phytanoyl-CoA dioxygenase family)
MLLSSNQAEQFKNNGFTVVPQLIDQATVEESRHYYNQILEKEIDLKSDRMLGGIIRQVMIPSKFLAYFRDNPALNAGKEIACQIFDTSEVTFYFDMLISKAPGATEETPWHQDYAYSQMPYAQAGAKIQNRSLHFWVALDDVDVSNGCMHFIPGKHLSPLLPHYVASGDPNNDARLLATDQVETDLAVACPINAGGCTIHFSGTPHYTSGNTSPDRHRRAYIFTFLRQD